MSSKPHLTAPQVRTVEELTKQHGLDETDLIFLSNGEPWLGSKARLRLARASKSFESIESSFGGYFIEPASGPTRPGGVQAVYQTTVVRDGRPYTMPGVATVGETLWNGEEAEVHELSLSRSIANACDAAGFNPLGRPRPLPTESQREEAEAADDSLEAAQRVTDLRRIHALARTVGLIKYKDERLYRAFLKEFYMVETSGAMDKVQRELLMNKLLTAGPDFVRQRSEIRGQKKTAITSPGSAGVSPADP